MTNLMLMTEDVEEDEETIETEMVTDDIDELSLSYF